MTIVERKTALRRELTARRKTLEPASHKQRSQAAADRWLANVPVEPGEQVALFWPLGQEIDPRPLMMQLFEQKISVALPRTHARAVPVTFHVWTPELKLARSAFGVEEPPMSSPQVDPDVIVVPLLGFDQACYRLGYGAGHYDCTLASMADRGLQPRTVGLAFALQQVEEVPREAHDVPLGMIVTDDDVWRRP